jgi:hypothetical protein
MIKNEDIAHVTIYGEKFAGIGKGKVVVVERSMFIALMRKAFPTMRIEDEE